MEVFLPPPSPFRVAAASWAVVVYSLFVAASVADSFGASIAASFDLDVAVSVAAISIFAGAPP